MQVLKGPEYFGKYGKIKKVHSICCYLRAVHSRSCRLMYCCAVVGVSPKPMQICPADFSYMEQ